MIMKYNPLVVLCVLALPTSAFGYFNSSGLRHHAVRGEFSLNEIEIIFLLDHHLCIGFRFRNEMNYDDIRMTFLTLCNVAFYHYYD